MSDHTSPSSITFDIVDCPSCGLPAEIVDTFTLGSTDGPVEHVKVVCIAGHWFTPQADRLGATPAPVASRVTA